MPEKARILVLFSGGLDSLLTVRLLQEQGLSVRCLHAISPFFGSVADVARWRGLHGLDIDILDMGEDFAALLRGYPPHGFGKVLNPCVDCKILMLRAARRHMEAVGANGLATGEVLGQRPMSQRRDTLSLIPREAGVADVLLRPLSALRLPPTPLEESGLVDRSRLLGLWGRGRTDQLALAKKWGVREIPTPGGGCRLTERENARRYWMALTRLPQATAADFSLANLGRQFWHERNGDAFWLCVGRHSADNERLAAALRPGDALLRLRDLPGPLALARGGARWPEPVLELACCHAASYAPKALAAGGAVTVRALTDGGERLFSVMPCRRDDLWGVPEWDSVKRLLRAEAKDRQEARRGG